MGARWMAEKQAKIRKQRRAYLKPYALHSGNKKPPNKDVLKEYQDRAKNITTPEKDKWLDTLFKPAWKVANHPEQIALRKQSPRSQAQKLKEHLEKEIPQDRKIFLQGNKYWSVVVYFEVNDGPAYFVEHDVRANAIRKSKVYSSLSTAKVVWQLKYVSWGPYQSLDPSPPS